MTLAFRAVLRRLAFAALYLVYLVVAVSILGFLTLETFPDAIRWMPAWLQRTPYYAFAVNYVRDPDLGFIPRQQNRDATHFGDLWDETYKSMAESLVPIRYQRRTTETGFPVNSKPPPYQTVFIGDSFMALSESPDNTLPEEFVQLTGQSAMNLGVVWYGPYQYLMLFERYVPVLKPKTVVVAIFAGNDLADTAQFEQWRAGGNYHWLGPPAPIWQRYVHAMRDLYRAARAEFAAALRLLLPAGLAPPVRPASPFVDVGLIDVGGRTIPMAFLYRNTRLPAAQLMQTGEWASLHAIVTQFRRAAIRTGTDILFVTIPSKEQVYGALATDRSGADFKKRSAADTPYDATFSEAFTLMARELDVAHLDLFPVFRQLAPSCLLYHPFDTHWNLYGRRVAAAMVARQLKADTTMPLPPDIGAMTEDRRYCSNDPNN
jgi:hypothetical protein